MVFHAVVRAKSELYRDKRPPVLWVWGPPPLRKKIQKIQNFKNVSGTDASMRVYSLAFWFDQWVTSIWRHVGLGVGAKKRQPPSILRGT